MRACAQVAAGAVALALLAGSADAGAPLYTLPATESCLTALPNAVAGLPPATPPSPPRLFVDALAGHDVSTADGPGPRPRPHRQIEVWSGDRAYQGIILSFFATTGDARASVKSLAWLYGGKLVRNVVVTWGQKPVPSRQLRETVLRCLRSGPAREHPPARSTPTASLATFAGRWGGHTRGLSITSAGGGRESTDDGCCTRVYDLAFQIVSVEGTLTRAVAVYRVTSFKGYERQVKTLHVGDIGKLRLKDGVVTNTLTDDYFCSDPAWGATGACGA
jgi:hypothetical protein